MTRDMERRRWGCAQLGRHCLFVALAVVLMLTVPGAWRVTAAPSVQANPPQATTPGETDAVGTVTVSLYPTTKTVPRNSTFDLVVYIAAGNYNVTSADVHLLFNPNYLRVTARATVATPFRAIRNVYSNTAGTIDFGAMIPNSFEKGTIVLCTLHFRAIRLTTPGNPTLIRAGSGRQAPLVVNPWGQAHVASWPTNGKVTIVAP